MKNLLDRYEELRQRCIRAGNLHPDSKDVCHQALYHVDNSLAYSLAMLLDDMALALRTAPTQVETQKQEHLFEFWWEEYMPEATQERAWKAWITAPRYDGVGIADQSIPPTEPGYQK